MWTTWLKIYTVCNLFLVANSDRDIKFLWSENNPFQFNDALSLPDFEFDRNAIVLRKSFSFHNVLIEDSGLDSGSSTRVSKGTDFWWKRKKSLWYSIRDRYLYMHSSSFQTQQTAWLLYAWSGFYFRQIKTNQSE